MQLHSNRRDAHQRQEQRMYRNRDLINGFGNQTRSKPNQYMLGPTILLGVTRSILLDLTIADSMRIHRNDKENSALKNSLNI